MYNLSDLSNLNDTKRDPNNNLDRYLALENILPHQNTLARGFQKGSHYDYIVSGTLGPAGTSNSNFHTRRLSDNKVANIMGDTFTKLNTDVIVSSGPTKYDAFKSKSKSLAPT